MRFAYSSLSVAILSSFSSLSFAEQIQELEHTPISLAQTVDHCGRGQR